MPQMTTDTLQLLLELPVLSPFMTYHRLCNCGGHEFILGFKWGSCRSISCLLYDVVCPVPSQGHCSFPSFTVVDRFKDSDYSSGGHEFILGSKWGLCRSISCLLYDVVCPLIILLISSNFSNIYLPRSYKALDLVCFRFFFCSLMFDI